MFKSYNYKCATLKEDEFLSLKMKRNLIRFKMK